MGLPLLQSVRNMALAAMLSCAPTVYATWPNNSPANALENMQAISADICGRDGFWDPVAGLYPHCERMSFTSEGLEYYKKDCVARFHHGAFGSGCEKFESERYFLYWDKIEKITAGRDFIKVCSGVNDCATLDRFRNKQQAVDFAASMNAYITAP